MIMATLRKIGHAYRIDDEYRDGYIIMTEDEMTNIIAKYINGEYDNVNK